MQQEPRSTQVLMDRAVPLLERCARGEVKMEYRLLAAQITEPGETVLNARALGLPLGLMMGTHDPERPWLEYLPAFVVAKKTGEPAIGWPVYRARNGLSELDPATARFLGHNIISAHLMQGTLLGEEHAEALMRWLSLHGASLGKERRNQLMTWLIALDGANAA